MCVVGMMNIPRECPLLFWEILGIQLHPELQGAIPGDLNSGFISCRGGSLQAMPRGHQIEDSSKHLGDFGESQKTFKLVPRDKSYSKAS